MKLLLTREDINSFLVESDSMDSNSPWCRKMSDDEIIMSVFEYAKENDLEYGCHAFHYNEDVDNFALAMISLNWNSDIGFSAGLSIAESEYISIGLDSVPIRQYGEYELYDFEEIINKGIELFNSNFNPEKYNM